MEDYPEMEMGSINHLYRQYAGCPLQLFGDMTKIWAETEGLSRTDADGISHFVTDETVMLLMQEWADEQLSTSGSPALPDHQALAAASRPDPSATEHRAPAARLVLDCLGVLTAHRSCDLPWDFGRIGSDDIRIRAEEVLLRAMQLYLLTYASSDPRLEAMCPTTGEQAFGPWPVYDPVATYRFDAPRDGLQFAEVKGGGECVDAALGG
ncbi:hypothetical protein MCOR27_003279 [Pyricularia oryzae]|nr:hypothetical protein MCOR01_009236 [Pyricularia oryzae]KAI6283400.1 hypothetical protein MCOR27_003279 [Pyricularia oryzae]KAI6385504.1 hypothetical protein MCOR32_001465 [Pyricularia oryzae]KAI6446925.1 hypothetical protein MCOR22_003576 [Pyricularia oryzae]KAI6468528.1 hypothetical protein MCOR15_002084 [Pyricularia oryzae]